MKPRTEKTPAECGCEIPSGSRCSVEAVVSLDERGQMVLPKDLRERAGIAPGEKLALVSWERDGAVCCLMLLRASQFTGMVKGLVGPLLQEAAAGVKP
ncbi:MAG: AbrB/MazE/SpoVT family DNA-binding domain-containing protein [Methanomicrobiales archaeon]|nr:AbrB/MazE/SpoVT family DNA-binding domain-containing protein [Methanomicrobiales archaeon]